MRAVSINILPTEESKEPQYMLEGQTKPTVTRCEMLEASLVGIPGNPNAVKLNYTEVNPHIKFKMAKENEKTVEQLNAELAEQRKLNAENLVERHKLRGVVQDAEVENLKTLALGDYNTVKLLLESRTPAAAATEENAAQTKALALVDLHFNRGAITAPEKETFKKLAMSDYDSVKKLLEARTGKDGLQTFVQGMAGGGKTPEADERAKWTYLDYFKKDPEALQLMQKNEPERHKQLIADFEAESKKTLQL
jgi:hypothetical protein